MNEPTQGQGVSSETPTGQTGQPPKQSMTNLLEILRQAGVQVNPPDAPGEPTGAFILSGPHRQGAELEQAELEEYLRTHPWEREYEVVDPNPQVRAWVLQQHPEWADLWDQAYPPGESRPK